MSHRHETSLIHRGSKVYTSLKHHTVPLAEFLSISLGSFGKVFDRSFNKVPSEHTTGVISRDGMSVLCSSCDDSIHEFLCLALEFIVYAILLEAFECFNSSSHGERVSGESSGLVHRTSGGDHLHDIPASTVSTYGKTSTDNLTHGGNIRCYAKVLLRTTVRNAESSHDFIKNKKSTVVSAHLAQGLQELLVGFDKTGVSNNRLKNDSSDFVLVILKDFLNRLNVVVFGTERGLGGGGRNTRRIRKAESSNARSSLHKEGISVTVVASLELDNLLTVRKRTHETDHTHARLGTRVGETNHFHGGHSIDHHFGKLVLKRAGSAEGSSLVHGGLYGIEDGIVGVSDDGGAPCSYVVDVLVFINVPGVRSLYSVEYDGVSSY
mmetsp:Transcript_13169/g.19268  ORF Transcript_13169/g.19268 Transcript_13169/m.19268 type:complete len:379 (-) Transcript_13169:292-1428(-)